MSRKADLSWGLRQRIAEQKAEEKKPSDMASVHTSFVFVQRLTGELDAEQAEQALEAFNGSIKES